MALATALADPQLDLATPMKGPFRTIEPPAPVAAAAAMRLARIAGLLPAFFVGCGAAEVTIAPADIDDATRMPGGSPSRARRGCRSRARRMRRSSPSARRRAATSMSRC
ncbi:hypothetical protein AB5I41_21280 [Sphingomonas sp. MMS24-JH45]